MIIARTHASGIAVSPARVSLAQCGVSAIKSVDIRVGGADSWPSRLNTALQALCSDESSHGPHAVVLMPSLAPVRLLRVPGMTMREVHDVVRRSPQKYFLCGVASQLVATWPTNPCSHRFGKRHSCFVSAVPRETIEVVHEALSQCGGVECIRSAVAVWQEALAEETDHGELQEKTGLFSDSGITYALLTRDREAVSLRFVSSDAGPARFSARIREARDAVTGDVNTEEASHGAFLPSCESRTVALRHVEDARDFAEQTAELEKSTAELTAARAGTAARGEFLSESQQSDARRWVHRMSVRSGLAAIAILVAAAGMHWRELHARLQDAAQARSTHRAAVMRALAGVDAHRTNAELVASVDSLRRTAPHWSNVLGTLSEHLPEESYLRAFRGAMDSIEVEGAAPRAASILDALRRVPEIQWVRTNGPIRQDADESQEAREVYLATLKLRSAAAPGNDRKSPPHSVAASPTIATAGMR